MEVTIKKETSGKITITVEDKVAFFFKRVRTYCAKRKICEGYWEWLKMPSKLLVPDHVSHQLDAWAREEEK